MVGGLSVPDSIVKVLSKHVDIRGAVPRSEISEHILWADVLLLPSLVEGSAGVTYEALSAGVPVICTPNTGSVVEHGVNGLIVSAGSAVAVIEAVSRFLEEETLLDELSSNSLQPKIDFTYRGYSNRLLSALSTLD
jgi:glycosyltransferase involved in cell wall biosynthesis